MLSSAIATCHRDMLFQSCDPKQIEPATGQDLYDMLHVSDILTRSQLTRIIQAPLFHRANRIAPLPFVFIWRYYLGYPRLIRRGRPTTYLPRLPAPSLLQMSHYPIPGEANLPTAVLDTPPPQVEVCALNHNPPALLTSTGKHACSCHATGSARCSTHNGLTQVFARAATAVGAASARPAAPATTDQ